MATAPAVLNRTRDESSLKAYGRLQGGVEQKDMTEEQKALAFNARISENYQRLINPDLNKAEEIAAPVYEAPAAPVYEAPAAQAPVFAEPVRQEAPAYEQRRVADVFRADSPLNTRAVNFEQAPVREYVQEVPYYEEEQGYVEDAMNADLMPTETTTQYRDNLYREEQRVTAVEEKKPRTALSARSKLMIMIYSIVVVVIMALIIVNTSVLNTLDGEVAVREAELNAAIAEQSRIEAEIELSTDPSTIIGRAENELGMYMPD